MKTLLTMVLTIGLSLTSAIAQEPPQRVTDCDNTEVAALAKRGLIHQNFPQPHRGLLGRLDISPEQWGRIKAERIKFGRVMKIARNDLGDSINAILTPEQQEALKDKREEWRLKAEQWRGERGDRGKNGRGHRRGNRRHNLPEEWKTWDDDAKREWKQERKAEWRAKREQRKEQHDTSKPETKTESTAKD